VELSNEVGQTPARDCGFTEGFHLGRARAGAYRGEGERDGGLGAENKLLTRPAASGGASAGNGAAAVAAAAAALASGEGEGAGGDRMASGGAGCRLDRGKPVGRAARPQRRRTAAMWSAPGGARRASARGRGEGETGPRGLAGPKGRRVGPAAPARFSFF